MRDVFVATPVVRGALDFLEARNRRKTIAERVLTKLLDEQLSTVPGRTGAQFAAPYWMEAPLFEDVGIPALVCGPSGGGLHSVDEWVDLRQVRAFPMAVVMAVERLADGIGGD